MSKGLGKIQRKALELAADGITLISPFTLAAQFGEPTEARIRSARRALLDLSKRGLITRHGFSGGAGYAIYGGPHAKRAQLESAYARAMQEFYKSQADYLSSKDTHPEHL